MNATGYVLAGVLLVVLIAVVFGAQQIEAQQASEFDRLMEDRNDAVIMAQEATTQRDAAKTDLVEVEAKVSGLESELASKDAEIAKIDAELTKVRQEAAQLQDRVDSLNGEKAQAGEQYADLMVRYEALQGQYNRVITSIEQVGPAPVPVTGLEESENVVCLPVAVDDLTHQLGAGLAVLLGMVVLGSGGYVVYRCDPNRKVSVKMSREQLREFARYQRERGKIAG